MVAIAFFSALALVLMWFPKFPLLPAAPWMSYDFSDVPVLIGTFSLGPAAGFLIVTIKNILYFITRSRSGLIGSYMNWATTVVFAMTAGLIYHYIRRSRWGALFGMAVGTVLFSIVAVVNNIYIALPAWGIPTEQIAPLVTSTVIPFNLLRGLISTLMTMLLYRRSADLIRTQLRL